MDSRGSSRRMACKSCRDRKVRCDGATPACDRCRRNGEECLYLPAYRPAKVELGHMVEMLQQRLDQTEARLQKLDSQQMTTQQMNAQHLNNQQMNNQQIRGQTVFNSDFGTATPLSLSTSMSPFTPTENIAMPQVPLDQTNFLAALSQNSSKSYPTDPPTGDFLKDLPLGNWVPNKSDAQQAQVDDAEMTDSLTKAIAQSAALPSLQELRLLNSASSGASSRVNPRASPSQAGQSPADASESTSIPHDLKLFLSDVFTTHTEIAGISAVVAEYLVWMRTAPHATTPEMLKTVESRLREIHELAHTKLWNSYKSMANTAEPRGSKVSRLRTYLGGVEDDTCRKIAEIERFFRDDYTVSLSLPEQRRPHSARS